MKITLDAHTKRRIDDNGFMHVEGCRISKACVNPYLGSEIADYARYGLAPNKIYQVYRKAEELEKAAPTFNGMPLLLGHFEESASAPQKKHRVGSIGSDCHFDFPYLIATLTITDQKAIDAVQSGESVEISCGYSFEPVLESGVFENQSYDFFMKDIRANHVALVQEGRAGKDVRVADSRFFNVKDLEGYDGSYKPHKKHITQGKSMKNLKDLRLLMDAAKQELKRLAADEGVASEAIEQAESDIAKAALAIQRIEAESEGKSPADFDINEDASMLDAMKACDIDAENPQMRKAFAEGVKYGEKLEKNPAERKKLDSEHESEGEKKALNADSEDSTSAKDATKDADGDKKTMDEKIKTTLVAPIVLDSAEIAQRVEQSMRAKHEAAQAVQPLVGKIIDPFAFDSAADIYVHACRLKGVSATADSAKDVCAVLRKQNTQTYTADAAMPVNALAAVGIGAD